MADLNSLFNQLREYKWRTVSFPTTHFSVSLKQDHADHKWPDRDGAHIEATGRSPLIFTAHIPFLNTIVPGRGESWGVLYPTTYRQFLAACTDRTTGTLQHPELGFIQCKVESLETKWSAGVSSGVEVDVTWIESTDSSKDLTAQLAAPSPIGSTELAALDLDADVGSLKNVTLPNTSTFKPTFEDDINTLKGVVDQATLFDHRIAGKIDSVTYRVNSLSDAIGGAKTDVRNWPVLRSIELMKASLFDLRNQLITSGKPISFYTVPKDSTLGGIANSISRSTGLSIQIGDILVLNPKLAGTSIVKAKTIVRYYNS